MTDGQQDERVKTAYDRAICEAHGHPKAACFYCQRDRIQSLEERLRVAVEDFTWIETVNAALDLRKLDSKTVIGLVYELRGKAKSALAKLKPTAEKKS